MVVVVAVVGAVDHQVSSVDDEMRVEKLRSKLTIGPHIYDDDVGIICPYV